MCPLTCWRRFACRSALFLSVMFPSVFQCFCFQQDRSTSNIYRFYTYTVSMSAKPNFFFWNLFCKFDTRFTILLGTFYWELRRVSSYSFRVPIPTGVAKRYRLLLMCRLHKACDLMTFKSLKIRSLFLNLLPHPPLGLLSSLPSIYILPSSHSKNHFLCTSCWLFALLKLLCAKFSFISWQPSSLPACYAAQRIRDILTQLCLSCKTSDGIIEEVVKIKSEGTSPIIGVRNSRL